MENKKKIILIVGITIIAIAIIIGLICLCTGFYNNKKIDEQGNIISKLNTLYLNLLDKGSYNVAMTVDDNNKRTYAKQAGKAYIDSIYDGEESKFIIRDGNSYLIMDDIKTCYEYRNNQTDLNEVEDAIVKIKDTQYESGEEKIENKKYKYEEYTGITDFTITDISDLEESEVKTRFYFDKEELVYIKTILPDKEELMKVEITYDVNESLFEIPSDYQMN